MAVHVLNNAEVLINSVDLSDHVRSVTVNDQTDLRPGTRMGDTGGRRLAGLADWEITIEFFQDFAAGKVDATLAARRRLETAISVKTDKDAVRSATNPGWLGNGMMDSYSPITGTVGEEHAFPVTFRGSDGVALIRETSSDA